MSVSIIIPAYNEQEAILETVQRIKALPIETEIILVNDGSTDNTANVARELDVILIDRPGNVGYGKSVKQGIDLATNDTIILTDADGTYPIEDIPKLIEEYNKGYDMVVGARSGSHYWTSPIKSFFRLVLKAISEFVSGQKIPDINSGLRVFSKQTVLPYRKDLCDTFSFTTTITLIYFLTKHTVAYVPISYEKRIGNSKVHHFRDSLRTMQYITECIATYNPIKLFLLFSIVTVLIGALSTIVLGWLGLFLGIYAAIFIFCIGLISRSFRVH